MYAKNISCFFLSSPKKKLKFGLLKQNIPLICLCVVSNFSYNTPLTFSGFVLTPLVVSTCTKKFVSLQQKLYLSKCIFKQSFLHSFTFFLYTLHTFL